MDKKSAKKQFDDMTSMLGLEHTFPFDTAWSFMQYISVKGGLENPTKFIPSKYSKEQFRKGILEVEKKMEKSDRTLKGKAAEYFNAVKHTFINGLYVREIFNPAGELIVTKIHKVEHLYLLMKGSMTIMEEGGERTITAPHYGVTKAGTKRIIYTHEDCIFITVHATDKTTVKEAEEDIIAKSFKDIKE